MKNKIIISTILLYSLSYNVFAQLPATQDKKKGKWQIGVNLNSIEPIRDLGANYGVTGFGNPPDHIQDFSFNTGLDCFYKLTGKIALRMTTKITKYHIVNHTDTREILPFSSSTYYIIQSKKESSIINISPGILWSWNYEKISPYGGFQVEVKKYNDLTINATSSEYNSSTNLLMSNNNQTIREEEGISFGAGPFAGFAIQMFKNIYIGADLSSSISYYKLGGTIEIIDTNTITTMTNTQHWQQTMEGIKFSNCSTSIILSIIF